MEKDLAEGEEKERDEDDSCESWERMRTKAMEAFVKLEFKRAARWFGKALENSMIEEEEEESREKRNRASLLANLSLALLRGNEKEEALKLQSHAKKKTRNGTKVVTEKRKLCMP